MPQKKSAYKEIRKSKKKHISNVRMTSELKTLIGKYSVFLAEKKFDRAKELLKAVASKLGRSVKKGIIHQNTAARKISRLSKKLPRT